MRCPSCEATVETAGVFPGGRTACAGCGAKVLVGGAPRRASSSPGIDAPYRVASKLSVEDAPGLEAPPPRAKGVPVCPRCAASLDGAADRDGLLSCGDCGGVFVSHEELEAALDRQKKAATLDARAAAPLAAEEVRYLACPRCDDRMSRSLFGKRSGIVVDVCKVHGTWFDADELTRAALFLDSEAKAASVARASERAAKGSLTADQLRSRAELEVLMMKESFDDHRRAHRQADDASDWLELLIDVLTWR